MSSVRSNDGLKNRLSTMFLRFTRCHTAAKSRLITVEDDDVLGYYVVELLPDRVQTANDFLGLINGARSVGS